MCESNCLLSNFYKKVRVCGQVWEPYAHAIHNRRLCQISYELQAGGYAPRTPISSRPLARPPGGPICPIFSYISIYFPIYFLYVPTFPYIFLYISYIFLYI